MSRRPRIAAALAVALAEVEAEPPHEVALFITRPVTPNFSVYVELEYELKAIDFESEHRFGVGKEASATDLRRPERFKNGHRPQDVYRTLMTGLAGTPMPSYADALEPDQAWDLV